MIAKILLKTAFPGNSFDICFSFKGNIVAFVSQSVIA